MGFDHILEIESRFQDLKDYDYVVAGNIKKLRTKEDKIIVHDIYVHSQTCEDIYSIATYVHSSIKMKDKN